MSNENKGRGKLSAEQFYELRIAPNNADKSFLVPSWAVDFAEKYSEYAAQQAPAGREPEITDDSIGLLVVQIDQENSILRQIKIVKEWLQSQQPHSVDKQDLVAQRLLAQTGQWAEQPAQPAPTSEWVSVDERLPEDQLPVLILTSYMKMAVAYSHVEVRGHPDHGWIDAMRPEHGYGSVTHWMPLPSSPTQK